MKLHDIISISPNVLENILLEETKKIPGIGGQSIENIKINDAKCEINIFLTPISLLSNIYSIANELQSAISFYLTKQFDIDEGKIKINIIVNSSTKGDK
ncbi:MAG: alkaline shock response membrane anchor protein AmaP [Mycoplasmoidaceae bacterium]|nr:alkaline shock response membrane anchor protein AmaP [Mycoplasmoidaceae bacterium]